jgi:SMC interacting uncharacterized protein involved in chromosome segregation
MSEMIIDENEYNKLIVQLKEKDQEMAGLRDKNAKDFQDYIHNISCKEEEIAELKHRIFYLEEKIRKK